MAHDPERGYWGAVAAGIGERCVFYSDEDLAAFAEGRIRGRNARALEAHLKDCDDCRGVVQELRRELAPEPKAVRVRFAPARGWVWAFAAGAVATALIAAVVLRSAGPGVATSGSGVGPRPPVNVAQAPPPRAGTHPSHSPSQATPRATVEAPPEVRRPAPGRRHLRPPSGAQSPGHTPSPSEAAMNVLPFASSLAFAEPLATPHAITPEVEELLREGAVNDLPDEGAEPPDKALTDEFYRGFSSLVQELRAEQEGVGQ